MGNREPFAPEEWYHCYNRGVDKRRVFETARDYQRFMQALYLCNNTEPVRQDNLERLSRSEIFSLPRENIMVAIGAHCLMPNHFHLLLKEIIPGGITQFMRKVGISYAMYFNIKNDRTGNLFIRPFRSKHIIDDRHFKYMPQYLHINPAELFEPGWKHGRVKNIQALEEKLRAYQYSSLCDYEGIERPERAILYEPSLELLKEDMLPIKKLLREAAAYLQEFSI